MNACLRQPDDWRFDGAARRRPGWLRAAATFALALVLTGLVSAPAFPQEVEVLLPAKESQVKYALLYSFGLLTTWPADAFDGAEDPFVIGVLGEKPFPEYLNRIAETKKIHNRSIVIRRYKSVDAVGRCHLLYVTSAAPADAEQAAARKFADQAVLIVGERGGVKGKDATTIQMIVELGTVKFMLNLDAARTLGLQIDPRLQKLAKRAASGSTR